MTIWSAFKYGRYFRCAAIAFGCLGHQGRLGHTRDPLLLGAHEGTAGCALNGESLSSSLRREEER